MSAGGLSAGPSVETEEQPAETRKPERKPRHARPRVKAGDAPAPERLRLLVLASTFPRSADDSTPSFVLELCRRLQSRFEVTVITPAVPGARERQ